MLIISTHFRIYGFRCSLKLYSKHPDIGFVFSITSILNVESIYDPSTLINNLTSVRIDDNDLFCNDSIT